MNLLSTIRIVLIHTTHPGNVGSTARAMKNMGLDQLYLVAPVNYPGPEAMARAADATDVLEGAVLCGDLSGAIAPCHFVVGTTARPRRIGWPTLDPAECAIRLLEEAKRGPVAVLFGQERSGLTNEELDRCQALVHIPSNPAYPSLNLASAVLILGYEIYRAAQRDTAPATPADPPATDEDMVHFYAHLERVLERIGFLDPDNPRLLPRRLRRLFNRAQPDRNEVNILRGVLTNVERALDKSSKG